MPQLQKKIPFTWQTIFNGFTLVTIGLFLKVTFADGIAPFVDKIFDAPQSFSSGNTLQGVLGYTIQILGDFWGYSTMAVGSALMFGISVPINFNLPYSAKSLQDFWRRWHITLSLWLRDYLYIPLGGSRFTTWLTYRNLLITMLLGGLWHGANWTFVIWGGIHGGVLAIERFVTSQLTFIPFAKTPKLKAFLQWSYTMAIVVVAWVFFRARNLSVAKDVLVTLASDSRHLLRFDHTDASFLLIFTFVPLHLMFHHQIHKTLSFTRHRMTLVSLSLLLLFLSIIFSAEDVQKFIYFEF